MGYILSPLLFNIYSGKIFQETFEGESIRIKVNGKFFNNIRYADDTTFVAGSTVHPPNGKACTYKWDVWIKNQYEKRNFKYTKYGNRTSVKSEIFGNLMVFFFYQKFAFYLKKCNFVFVS